MSEDIVVTTVTITRTYHPAHDNPNEAETIRVDTEGDPSLVDVLGMLEFAKIDLIAPAFDEDD